MYVTKFWFTLFAAKKHFYEANIVCIYVLLVFRETRQRQLEVIGDDLSKATCFRLKWKRCQL